MPIASRTSARVSEEIARAFSAPARQDRLESRLVRAQLGVALAHRRQVIDHRIGDRGLEVAVARALELALDLLGGDAADRPRGSRSGW